MTDNTSAESGLDREDRHTLTVYARIWWERNMPGSNFTSATVHGSGRVSVNWRDTDGDAGRFTLPVDFLTDTRPTPPAEHADVAEGVCSACGGDGQDGAAYVGAFPCGPCNGTGTIKSHLTVEATIEQNSKVEIRQYAGAAGAASDKVMIWVNDRDTTQGGYVLECVPRHVAPTIVSALEGATHWKALAKANGNALVQAAMDRQATDRRVVDMEAENTRLREALEKIATVDMGGGFMGAQACRKVAHEALASAGDDT